MHDAGDTAPETIPRLLAAQATRRPHALAIQDGAHHLDFAALLVEVHRAAAGLLALGTAPGDRVAIQAPNRWEWIVAALAIHQVGGVLVPINTRFRGDETAHILRHAGARILYASGPFLGSDYVAQLEGAALPELRGIILLPGAPVPAARWSVWPWAEVIEGGVPVGHARTAGARVRPDDPSDILYTSGTTGQPKGVPTTHAQSLRVYTTWASVVGLREDDRYLIVPPFFHCFGYKAGWLACLLTGATALPHAVFEAGAVAGAPHDGGVLSFVRGSYQVHVELVGVPLLVDGSGR